MLKKPSRLKTTVCRLSLLFVSVSGLIFLQLDPASALAVANKVPYYGDGFYNEVARGTRDGKLILALRTVLESRHRKNGSGMDTVPANCDTAESTCYQHRSIGYGAARKVLMGRLHLEKNATEYVVKDVYCEHEFTNGESGVGPDKVPAASKLNTEHTWPQSRFNGSMGKDVQKSDLHHLYPTDSEMNSVRGNHKFGDVEVADKSLKCPTVKFGTAHGSSEDIFEPPVAHKGNVARALFYFSVRYRLAIDPHEESFLREWHRKDPVDLDEKNRNEAIMKVQGNRNPFVDHPELADAISDF